MSRLLFSNQISIKLESRQIRVGLGTTVNDTYETGNTFLQAGTNATANLVGTAGSATGSLTVSNPGIGYTPSSGSATFTGVTLSTLTGNGRGAQADINIVDGLVNTATITAGTNGGSGYQIGDVLGINVIGIGSVGRNARLTMAGIGNTGELVLENVQGGICCWCLAKRSPLSIVLALQPNLTVLMVVMFKLLLSLKYQMVCTLRSTM